MSRSHHITPRPTRAWSAGAYALALACLVALDQLVKGWARAALVPGEPMCVVPNVLSLSLVRNEGAAFGIGAGHAGTFVLLACAVVAVSVAYVLVGRRHTRLEVLSLAAVAAGAVGNAVDRVSSGAVTDMFALTFVSFPVFNVADIAITCGCVLFVVSTLLNPDDEPASGMHAGEGSAA